jgi:hypothetical protein
MKYLKPEDYLTRFATFIKNKASEIEALASIDEPSAGMAHRRAGRLTAETPSREF